MNGKGEQIQIVRKLDKLEQELNELRDLNKELLKRLEELEFESYYPPESKIKKSYIKKIAKIDEELKRGKYHTYKTFEDFEKAMGAR